MAEEEGRFPASDTMRRARVVLHGGLVALARRTGPFDLSFRADQSLRHEAEVLGIPAVEIGRALADGALWPLELPPPDASLVELFPLSEPLLTSEEPRFVADVHLGRLARDLRLLGFDVLWRNDFQDFEIVELALAEARTVLTRDRGLLYRRAFRPYGEGASCRGMLILSPEPYEQLLTVLRRFDLSGRMKPLCRCASCGALLRSATKAEARPLVPTIVLERYEEFFLCPECGKAYWKGDHFRSIAPLLDRLDADLGNSSGEPPRVVNHGDHGGRGGEV